MRRSIAFTLASVLVAGLSGCSSGSGSPATGADGGGHSGFDSGGNVPCTDAAPAPEGGFYKVLSMPVQGGLTGTLTSATGYGYVGSPPDGPEIVFDDNSGLISGTRVTFHLSQKLADGATGPLPLDSIAIAETTDAGTYEWQTPDGACSATITSAACTSSALARFTFDGNGSCSAPATPRPVDGGPTNASGPVTIEPFTFGGSL
jgi:hypothetical protein